MRKLTKKTHKKAFFYKKICTYKKNILLLQRILQSKSKKNNLTYSRLGRIHKLIHKCLTKKNMPK